MPHKETTIEAHGVQSLAWVGDTLVDIAAGGYWDKNATTRNGAWVSRGRRYGRQFDGVIISPSGRYTVVYTRNGTKGIVLGCKGLIREINRSYYHSGSFDYPVTIAQYPDGKEVLIHCPSGYNILQAEDIETGEVIQNTFDPNRIDFFHSGLTMSPDQRRLISAGWIWHPFGRARLYAFQDGVFRSIVLPHEMPFLDTYQEIAGAEFLDNDNVYIATSNEEPLNDEEDPVGLARRSIALWSLQTNKLSSVISCDMEIGEMMPISSSYVVSFHTNPRLWDMEAKEAAYTWPHISSGLWESTFMGGKGCIAKDGPNKRFAVAHDNRITIVELDLP
jgi:WD40 repeat protein